MKLHLYFARRFLMTFLIVLAIFSTIFVLLDMVENLRKFDAKAIGFVEIFRITVLNVPTWVYRIQPLIVILATLALFLSLARSSEMVVTRAAGRSALKSLISPMIAAFLIGLLSLAAMNPIVAATSRQYDILVARYSASQSSISSISRDGLWLRQGSATGQVVIRADRSGHDGTELFGATFIAFDPDGAPRTRIQADSARLTEGQWQLTGAKVWDLSGASDNPEAQANEHPTYHVVSNLTQDEIRDSFGAPSSIPIWELPRFIDRLEQAGFSATRHQIWLQSELATPLFLVAMVLIGAGFTMRHTRFGHAGMMVLAALGLGFGLYFIRNFAHILGENGQIPVMIAAWTPPIAAVLVALGILLHLEDG